MTNVRDIISLNSASVNSLFTSFANFVSKLTGKKVGLTPVEFKEEVSTAWLKIEKLLNDATDALDIGIVGSLEPGRIYVLVVDFANCNVGGLEDLIRGLREFSIEVVCIDKNSMEFVNIPDGYEIVKT